jgi:hypothetical protein
MRSFTVDLTTTPIPESFGDIADVAGEVADVLHAQPQDHAAAVGADSITRTVGATMTVEATSALAATEEAVRVFALACGLAGLDDDVQLGGMAIVEQVRVAPAALAS